MLVTVLIDIWVVKDWVHSGLFEVETWMSQKSTQAEHIQFNEVCQTTIMDMTQFIKWITRHIPF